QLHSRTRGRSPGAPCPHPGAILKPRRTHQLPVHRRTPVRKATAVNNPISPKVKASGLTGIIATLVVAILSQFEDSITSWAGDWTPTVYLVAVVAASAGVAYLKGDPSRVIEIVDDYLSPDEEREEISPVIDPAVVDDEPAGEYVS